MGESHHNIAKREAADRSRNVLQTGLRGCATPCWHLSGVYFPTFLKPAEGKASSAFQSGKANWFVLLFEGIFCNSFCLAWVQNETETSGFKLFNCWVLACRGLQAGKLCWPCWIFALSASDPSLPLTLRSTWTFLDKQGKSEMFHPYSQISLEDATHQSMLLLLVTHLNLISPKSIAHEISSLTVKHGSQTLGDPLLPHSSPWKALSAQTGWGTHLPFWKEFTRKSLLISAQSLSPVACHNARGRTAD